MMNAFLNMYFLMCGFHGLIQSIIILFTRKGQQLENRFLSIYIFSFSIILIDGSLKLMDDDFLLPAFLGVPFLFCGFLLFLYVKKYTGHTISRAEVFYHSIPAIIATMLFAANLIVNAFQLDSTVFSNNPVINNISINAIGTMHFISYLTLAVYQLRKPRQQVNIDTKEKWIRFLITISLTTCVISLILIGFNVLLMERFNLQWAYLVWSIMSIFIFSIGYIALQRPEVFNQLPSALLKYRNTKISGDTFQKSIDQIEYLMKKEFIYRQPDLTLDKLAGNLNLQPNVLSRIINEHYQLNYNQFLNEFRLEEVKQKIADPTFDKYTILSIALDAGFNSKSSFNEQFKKQTSLSPNEFKKRIRSGNL